LLLGFTIKESKKSSWQKYVTTISTETPTTEFWLKIRKIRGLGYNPSISLTDKQNKTILSDKKIVETFANRFEDVSSTKHYDQRFLATKGQMEKESQNITEEHFDGPINNIFNMDELD